MKPSSQVLFNLCVCGRVCLHLRAHRGAELAAFLCSSCAASCPTLSRAACSSSSSRPPSFPRPRHPELSARARRLVVLAVKMSFESSLSLTHLCVLLGHITPVTRLHEASLPTVPHETHAVLWSSVRSEAVSSVAEPCFLVVTKIPLAPALDSLASLALSDTALLCASGPKVSSAADFANCFHSRVPCHARLAAVKQPSTAPDTSCLAQHCTRPLVQRQLRSRAHIL